MIHKIKAWGAVCFGIRYITLNKASASFKLTWQAYELQTPQVVEDQVAEYKSAMDSISQFVIDECEQDVNHICAASKFYQAYRDWCCSAGRKPQSQTAFKRALEKLNGVDQRRSSSGLQWHGIQPCLAYWCSRCRLCSSFWKLSTGISVGIFRIGLHSLHSLHFFLLVREKVILIEHSNLVDTQ